METKVLQNVFALHLQTEAACGLGESIALHAEVCLVEARVSNQVTASSALLEERLTRSEIIDPLPYPSLTLHPQSPSPEEPGVTDQWLELIVGFLADACDGREILRRLLEPTAAIWYEAWSPHAPAPLFLHC